MKIKFISAILTAAALTGCASAPTHEQMSKANYGEYPNDWKQIVDNYLHRALRDPSSMQLRDMTHPKQGFINMPLLRGGGSYAGWVVCMQVNAKNAYGGYTGFKSAFVMINAGKVALAHIDTSARDDPQNARRFCNQM